MSNPGFEYDTISSYAINFQCTDSNGETSATRTLTINILPNTPPTISGLPTSVTVNDGEDGPLKIYDVSVTDVESDSFSCSLSPTGTPFNYQSSPGKSALQFSLKHKSIPKSCWLSSLIPFPYLFTSMLYFARLHFQSSVYVSILHIYSFFVSRPCYLCEQRPWSRRHHNSFLRIENYLRRQLRHITGHTDRQRGGERGSRHHQSSRLHHRAGERRGRIQHLHRDGGGSRQ